MSVHAEGEKVISPRATGYPGVETNSGTAGLPDFFVIGPPRTGTTWLHDVLTDRVNLPRIVKEPQFFDLRYAKGLQWYRDLFAPVAPGLPIGEMGATYFYSVKARERIARVLPQAKIICTLRDPVGRLYSLYRLLYGRGALKCSFRDAVSTDPELIESTRYHFHLTGWMDLFGREQVLVLRYEQLAKDPEGYVAAICRFIGIAPFAVEQHLIRHTNSSEVLHYPRFGRLTHIVLKGGSALKTNRYNKTLALLRKVGLRNWLLKEGALTPPPLDPDFAEAFRTDMRPEVDLLEELLNMDLSSWKPKSA